MLHHVTSESMALTDFMPTMSIYKLVITSVFIQIKISLLLHVQRAKITMHQLKQRANFFSVTQIC